MSKGIIIVDMPESCDECPYESRRDWVCSLTGSDTFANYGMDRFKKRLDGCPIIPMPEKIEYSNRQEMAKELIAEGWNACIDEITERLNNGSNK